MQENQPIAEGLIDQALYQVCVKGGYCTKLTGKALLKKYQNNVTADKFATAVHFAEGLNTKYSDGRELIEQVFLKCTEIYCKK